MTLDRQSVSSTATFVLQAIKFSLLKECSLNIPTGSDVGQPVAKSEGKLKIGMDGWKFFL